MKGVEQRNDSDRQPGARGWVAEKGDSALVVAGLLVLVVGHVIERDPLVFGGILTLGVGTAIKGFVRHRGDFYKGVTVMLAVALLVNGLDLLLPSEPLWAGVIDLFFQLGLFVAGFVFLLYAFRKDLDEELERLLFYRAGTFAFFATMLVSFMYWGLRSAPQAERFEEHAHGLTAALPLPEPSLVWVVLFGIGVWLVSMGVLWWRSR